MLKADKDLGPKYAVYVKPLMKKEIRKASNQHFKRTRKARHLRAMF